VLSPNPGGDAASGTAAVPAGDIYGHLMPGSEDEAAALLDAYLERADTKARTAAIGG
jgi:hypothetical protein